MITAEFAVVVPAVVLVLAMGLSALQVGVIQLRAADAAADGARSLGRGDGHGTAAARVARVLPGATMSSGSDGDLVCVQVEATAGAGIAAWIPVSASSCAMDAGR
ncbi:MAG TPA: TadE family type IV pilus minor pilin [Plantibacter sp.]|uniref:TadE family type IV pilus minor pilin n=1 Tax=unclassified Plantibacter TaxID=2624265 RepID=UPI002B798136|nr:TadE family type IV pilus minor pilin [Plantibacter sp.]